VESLGQAARRLLRRLERAAKAREIDAGRVEQSERSTVFPDATERRPAPDADSIGDEFTVPVRVSNEPGNARQGLENRMRPSPPRWGRGAMVLVSAASPLRSASNDNRRDHGRASYGLGKPL
jgi:hypothetical protein